MEKVQSIAELNEDTRQAGASIEDSAASSTEGLRTSENTVENMKSCRTVLESIYESAKNL